MTLQPKPLNHVTATLCALYSVHPQPLPFSLAFLSRAYSPSWLQGLAAGLVLNICYRMNHSNRVKKNVYLGVLLH